MKELLRFVAALVLVLAVHLVGTRAWGGFPTHFDFFILLTVLVALRGDTLRGLLAGLACGLVEDAVVGGFYGLYGIANTILGYVVARFAQQLAVQQRRLVGIFFTVTVLLQQLLVSTVLFGLTGRLRGPTTSEILIKSLLGGLIGLVLVSGARSLGRRREYRRIERKARVRL